jgi:hypothetical protein
MPLQLKTGFGRIVAARQALVDVRAARWETLQRFKNFAKAKMGDFISTTDPISGQRLADISAGGDKARGEAAMVLGMFEGTRMRLTVDAHGQFGAEINPPEMFADVGRVVDIDVPMDLSRAVMVYEPAAGPAGSRRTLDLDEVITRMVENAARVVEEELGDAASPSTAPPRSAPPAAPKTVFSFSAT